MILAKRLILWLLTGALPLSAFAADFFTAGPAFSEFPLTLAPGYRMEAAGPFFYKEQIETRKIWAVPPLLSYTHDPGTESTEFDFVYPVITYDRYGGQYRFQIFQLLSWAGGPSQTDTWKHRFTIFPIFFYQRASDPSDNYTAYGPFYGNLKNRLMRDEIHYILFPLYSETRKKDVVTDNYVYPFFHLRHGNNLKGWQFWPIVGHENKGVTYTTNGFGDISLIGGHDRWFAAWPLFYNQYNGIGTTNLQHQQGVLPAYLFLRSPLRDSTTVLWPFFSKINDREKQYREWHAPYPFVVIARGKGKTTTRVFPLFSKAHSDTLESDFYLWPVYKYNAVHAPPLDRHRTRILFFLYSDLMQKNTETGQAMRRMDLFPFFTRRKEYDGSTRLQVLAILEPFLPGNRSVERDYAPVYSFWRAERNAKTGASSQSLLWNLYRHQVTPEAKKTSILFGLFQYQSTPEGKRVRLFYIPFGKDGTKHPHGAAVPAGRAPDTNGGATPGTTRRLHP